MLTMLRNLQSCLPHNVKKYLLIAVFCVSFACFSANAQTGRALSFDGTNDYVSLPTGLSGSYTKEVWINAASFTGFPNILSGTGTAIFLNAGRIAAGHSTGGFTQILDPATLVSGTWYHIAVTYNAGTGDMQLYKNGLLIQTASAVPAYTEPLLEIGRYSGSNFFTGSVDELRLWHTVRTAGQISGSMNCELTDDEPGLLAYYNFNQGTAGGTNTGITTLNDTKDVCIAANGTLNNFALTGASSNWIAPGPVLTGTCAGSFPNINITGNSICITAGDTSPSLTDFTNFGDVGTLPVTRNFIIQNTGNAPLNLTSVTILGVNASDFSITGAPATTLAPSASTTISVSFSPSGANGIKNAIISIDNNDIDEPTFAFSISGNFAGGAQALAFDGVNDRVDLPFTFSGSYTKEAWINTNTLTGFPNILSGDPNTGTAIFLNNGRLAAGHGPGFAQVLDAAALSSGTWYHVAVTYNAGTGVMNLYKNAALVATASSVAGYTETVQQIGTFSAGNFFNGLIDEVRFWNTARSAADILSTMNCALNGTEAGLIAYYNFNQGAQAGNNAGLTVLNDLVGNCPQNGTLVNFALNGSVSNWVSPGGTTGSCTPQVSNISVTGNNICIPIADVTPVAADNTDYGLVTVPNTADHSFVITNNGGAALTISSIVISGVDAALFTVQAAPATSVLPGASTTFIIRFIPSGANGIKNATITINNNDANEAAYNFAVRGEVFDPLPVTLVYFNASNAGRYSRLVWETATEINNKGFEIQRSINGSNAWETIGYVPGTNITNGSKYSFNDLAPLKGINTYRLNQLDFDGRSSLSKIEAVDFAGNDVLISVYPNPVKDKLNLVFNDAKLINSNAKITTASGTVLASVKLTNYRQQVDMSAFAKGIYFISLQDGTVLRIVKQ
ncbi:MAG: choice-of-anchor D domain-containing protein [Chitinophagaceae bacterium]|nr:MAG: choice-of-anchor D domain-containing protein [Chitinophagaceae bacterium]